MIKLFQKFAQVEGAKPSSRPQAQNFSIGLSIRAANYWFISLVYLLKERTEMVFSHNIPTKKGLPWGCGISGNIIEAEVVRLLLFAIKDVKDMTFNKV
ncbi:MAG: hypothetical protein IJF08_09560, partial [Clostridia bacterium]|nr:hypothetical protein [Clostridia bacterium]